MELLEFEKNAIQYYIAAKAPFTPPTDVIYKCRESAIDFFKSILIEKYNFKTNSTEVVKETLKTISTLEFFGKKEGGFKSHTQLLGVIKSQVDFITNLRNRIAHPEPNDKIDDETLDSLAKQCLVALEQILKWYVNIYKKIQLTSITNLNFEQREALKDIFKSISKKQEMLVIKEREFHYIILLIDSSQSMLWPYLQDFENNYNKPDTLDYKNAVEKVQKAMEFAHEKALKALRGSSPCKDGYLMAYQIIFNHQRKVLNAPEFLSSESYHDKVFTINKENYFPDGQTALYETINHALNVIFENHIREPLEKEGRVDKVAIGVITDGEDTVANVLQKSKFLSEIKLSLDKLSGNGNERQRVLISSALIGLTSGEFTEKKLEDIRKELNFEVSFSINQTDEKSIRQAFKLFSTNALNA